MWIIESQIFSERSCASLNRIAIPNQSKTAFEFEWNFIRRKTPTVIVAFIEFFIPADSIKLKIQLEILFEKFRLAQISSENDLGRFMTLDFWNFVE